MYKGLRNVLIWSLHLSNIIYETFTQVEVLRQVFTAQLSRQWDFYVHHKSRVAKVTENAPCPDTKLYGTQRPGFSSIAVVLCLSFSSSQIGGLRGADNIKITALESTKASIIQSKVENKFVHIEKERKYHDDLAKIPKELLRHNYRPSQNC